MDEGTSHEEILREFIHREFLYGRQGVELDPETPLFEKGIIDSVGILRLVRFVESRFDVRIRPEDLVLKNFATIGAISRLLRGS